MNENLLVFKSRSSRVVDFLFFCLIFPTGLVINIFPTGWVILTIGCISWAVISELGSSFVLRKKSFVNSVFLPECKWIIWEIEMLPVIPVAFLETKIRDKKNENYAIWPNSSHSAVPSFPIKLSSWLKLFGGRIECMETFRQTFNIHIISSEIHSDWFVELKSFSNMSLYDIVFTFCCSFYSSFTCFETRKTSQIMFSYAWP